MPYCPTELRVAAFIAGRQELYQELASNPELRMIPISRLEQLREDLKQLGYRIRIRYRGPHGRQRDTLKSRARAFTVYIQE